MFLNLFRIYSILITITTAMVDLLVADNLYKLLLADVEAKKFIKLSSTLDRWLGIIYLVKVQRMYRIFVLKALLDYLYNRITCHKLD